MAPLPIAKRMEQVIRTYIEACNNADATAISACFRSDAVHYGPGIPRWSGAAAIGGNLAKRVSETGQWLTVDQLVTDADRCAAALEWTRFDPSSRQIVRGVDWFDFEEETVEGDQHRGRGIVHFQSIVTDQNRPDATGAHPVALHR